MFGGIARFPIFFPCMIDAMMVHYVNHTNQLAVSLTLGDDDRDGKINKKARKTFLHTYNQSLFHVCELALEDCDSLGSVSGLDTPGSSGSHNGSDTLSPPTRSSHRASMDRRRNPGNITHREHHQPGQSPFTFHLLVIEVPAQEIVQGISGAFKACCDH